MKVAALANDAFTRCLRTTLTRTFIPTTAIEPSERKDGTTMTTRKSLADTRIAEFQAMAEADRLVRRVHGTTEPKHGWSLGRLVRIHRTPAAV